jgi:homoserine kinase
VTPPAPAGGVRVRVPATSANLGPGFDAIGLALELYEEVWLRPLPDGTSRPQIAVHGVGAGRLVPDENLLAYRGVVAVYRHLRRPVPPLALELVSRIPRSGGLGGSAAAIVGGAVAANVLLGSPLSAAEVLDVATAIEGHPDNVAAALHGGLVISVQGRHGLVIKRVDPPPGLRAVVCMPDQPISTRHSRGGVLPQQVPLADAVFNLGRTALLVAAFHSGDWGLLRDAMDDRLHQPPRSRHYPALIPTIEAALAAGAHGAALSGSGSTIIALATEREPEIAAAMRTAAAAHGFPGRTAVLELSSTGAVSLGASSE